MIALDAVIAPLLDDTRHAVEMRIVAVVQILDNLAISRHFVDADDDQSVETDALNRMFQKGFGCFRVAPGSSHRYCVSTVDRSHPNASSGRARSCGCMHAWRSGTQTFEPNRTLWPDQQRSLARPAGPGRRRRTVETDNTRERQEG